jgi:hypothetical protein
MFVPSEDDPPLVIDADGMRARQISLRGFEPVSGRNCKIL